VQVPCLHTCSNSHATTNKVLFLQKKIISSKMTFYYGVLLEHERKSNLIPFRKYNLTIIVIGASYAHGVSSIYRHFLFNKKKTTSEKTITRITNRRNTRGTHSQTRLISHHHHDHHHTRYTHIPTTHHTLD